MPELTPDVLNTPGSKITLANGTELTLRYRFDAIIEIEKEHGSVNALVEKLNLGEKGPVFSILAHALWAGTERKMPLPEFVKNLEPSELKAYSVAFNAAIQKAMGTEPGEASAAEAA